MEPFFRIFSNMEYLIWKMIWDLLWRMPWWPVRKGLKLGRRGPPTIHRVQSPMLGKSYARPNSSGENSITIWPFFYSIKVNIQCHAAVFSNKPHKGQIFQRMAQNYQEGKKFSDFQKLAKFNQNLSLEYRMQGRTHLVRIR